MDTLRLKESAPGGCELGKLDDYLLDNDVHFLVKCAWSYPDCG